MADVGGGGGCEGEGGEGGGRGRARGPARGQARATGPATGDADGRRGGFARAGSGVEARQRASSRHDAPGTARRDVCRAAALTPRAASYSVETTCKSTGWAGVGLGGVWRWELGAAAAGSAWAVHTYMVGFARCISGLAGGPKQRLPGPGASAVQRGARPSPARRRPVPVQVLELVPWARAMAAPAGGRLRAGACGSLLGACRSLLEPAGACTTAERL